MFFIIEKQQKTIPNFRKILNLLNESSNSGFVKKTWNIANDHSNLNYDVGNEIIFDVEILCLHTSKEG